MDAEYAATIVGPKPWIERLQIKSIVCPIDFSEFSAKAYDYARSLAGYHGAKLYVLNVQEWNEIISQKPYLGWAPGSALPELRDLFLQSAQVRIEQFVEHHMHTGVQPVSIAQYGLPVENILALAEQRAADLIVMGTHGRHGLTRLVMGSVTEEILRNSLCPVLVVRKPSHDFVAPENLGNPITIRHILCCIDFSDLTDEVLRLASSICSQHAANLTLLHVQEDGVGNPCEQIWEKMRQLETLLKPDQHEKCQIKAIVCPGRASNEIVKLEAETKADLTVMGLRGHRTVSETFLGTTVYQVIEKGSLPVVVVRS